MYLTDVQCFPVLPCLERLSLGSGCNLSLKALNLHAFESLHSLHLDSCGIVDEVSYLDGIQELKLSYCFNLRDISCLNNNYKVYIMESPKISIYSKSFRYSRDVSIAEARNGFTISLDSCLSLNALSISGSRRSYTSVDMFSMDISTLSFLSLDSC